MYKVALCDDSLEYVNYLKNMLLVSGLDAEKVNFYEYDAGESLVKHLDISYDMVFLDIHMKDGGLDGNETAKLLRRKNKKTLLIFCTGLYLPMPETFKVQPFRYLLKEYDDMKMIKELKEIIAELKSKEEGPYLIGAYRRKKIRVNTEDILYISVVKRGSEIWVNQEMMETEIEGTLFLADKLKDIYTKLNEYGFAYAHNSYIVNMRYVKEVNSAGLRLADGTELSIARSKSREFQARFSDYLSRRYKG